MTNTMSNN